MLYTQILAQAYTHVYVDVFNILAGRSATATGILSEEGLSGLRGAEGCFKNVTFHLNLVLCVVTLKRVVNALTSFPATTLCINNSTVVLNIAVTLGMRMT